MSLKLKVKDEELVTLEDGYIYYWPKDFLYGCFSSNTLREIADYIDKLNEKWDEQVKNDLTILDNLV